MNSTLRSCLVFATGLIVGAGLMALWRPNARPPGQSGSDSAGTLPSALSVVVADAVSTQPAFGGEAIDALDVSEDIRQLLLSSARVQ
jgi:hypothetical protein